MLLYLPPYSPDLNPIELSFSTCLYQFSYEKDCALNIYIYTGKAFLRRHGEMIQEAEDPIAILLESTACITGEMAHGWFKHAGYISVAQEG